MPQDQQQQQLLLSMVTRDELVGERRRRHVDRMMVETILRPSTTVAGPLSGKELKFQDEEEKYGRTSESVLSNGGRRSPYTDQRTTVPRNHTDDVATVPAAAAAASGTCIGSTCYGTTVVVGRAEDDQEDHREYHPARRRGRQRVSDVLARRKSWSVWLTRLSAAGGGGYCRLRYHHTNHLHRWTSSCCWWLLVLYAAIVVVASFARAAHSAKDGKYQQNVLTALLSRHGVYLSLKLLL